MVASVHTLPASGNDREFLRKVYASTRQQELEACGWPARQQESFVRMQFEARRRSYEAQYPSATESIIMDENTPAGSWIVFRGPSEIRLVDIALLPEHRGRGIGSRLISTLIREAMDSNLPLRLSVLRGNRAIRLYERLGFVVISSDSMYLEMECPG